MSHRWTTLVEERSDLVADPRIRELAGIGETDGELDLDAVGADLAAMLTDQLVIADGQLAAEHAQALEDERLRDGLHQDGFRPPPRHVEQAVTALRELGAEAVAGMQFLRDTVPAPHHDAAITAIPHLVGGVVVCGPVPGGDLAALARRADVALPTVLSLATDDQARALLSKTPDDTAVLPPRRSTLDADAAEEELHLVNVRLATVDERRKAVVRRREADHALRGRLLDHLAAFDARTRTALRESLARLDQEKNTLTERTNVLLRQAAETDDARRRAQDESHRYTDALRTLAAALSQVRSLVEAAHAVEHWATQHRHAQAEARKQREAAQASKTYWQDAHTRQQGAETALGRNHDQARQWQRWMQEIRQELSADDLRAARPAALSDNSAHALHQRWTQAKSDLRNGISDTVLHRRLTTAETAIKDLDRKLDEADPAARTRAAELLDRAQTMTTERLTARIADAANALKDAERAQAKAEVLLGQVMEEHQEAVNALDDFPDAQAPVFASTREARDHLDAARQLLEHDDALIRTRRLEALEIHRRADQAQHRAAQLGQTAGVLHAAGDTSASEPGADNIPRTTADVYLLEHHGLSEDTAHTLQPHDAERIKDALCHEVTQANRALEKARSALHKDVLRVERLAQQPEYLQIVDERLRERLQQDVTAPTRLATLLEDIQERQRQVAALLAESAEDQARVVDACTSTVEAVLDMVEEVARHSRLPHDLGNWSNQRFLTLDLRQRATGDELARRLSAEVDRLVTALPTAAAGRSGTLPEAIPLTKQLVLAALGGRGNITAKIIKPTPSPDTIERECVTEIKEFSDGERLTVSVLLYCTLAHMRATRRDRRSPGGVGTLVLDNPLGKANFGPFVDLQRRVAAAHGIQLLYTTGSNDLPALARFPLIIRTRNARDLRTKRRYVQILERHGAGVAHAQDDGFTSAHLLRSAALHTQTEPDPRATLKQEAG